MTAFALMRQSLSIPWRAVQHESTRLWSVRAANNTRIATDLTEAQATFLAAAPDIYDALSELVTSVEALPANIYYGRDGNGLELWQLCLMAYAVMEKARGEQEVQP